MPDSRFRLLLDEHFPSPGFNPTVLDRTLDVVALRDFDRSLVGRRTPDWYLYLSAHEAGFNALVTRDWHQSGQAEEMWALTKTRLSIVTWRKAVADPVVEWGQMMAYLPEIRRMLRAHGPSIVFLPRPNLSKDHLEKAGKALAEISRGAGRAKSEVLREAEQSVQAWLHEQGQDSRFGMLFSQPGSLGGRGSRPGGRGGPGRFAEESPDSAGQDAG